MLCPEEFATMINAVSLALSKGKCISEINLLSAAFTQIGDTLATIAVQKQNICDCIEDNAQNNSALPL